jgi:hypothetical protein
MGCPISGHVIECITKCFMVSGYSHFKEQYCAVGEYNSKRVEKFSYLGSLISHDNDVSLEIKQHILVANKCYDGLARQLKYTFLSHYNKIKIYETLIRPVLLYGSETWPLKIGDIESLGVYKRRILRAIYGPVSGLLTIWKNVGHPLLDMQSDYTIPVYRHSKNLVSS